MIDCDGLVAPDVVCILGETSSSLFSTEFHINLSKGQSLTSQLNPFGSISFQSYTEEELKILISCNGTICYSVIALLNEEKMVEFIESNGNRTNCPSGEILKHLGLLRGKNTLLFESSLFEMKVECSVYLWNVTDKIVVVDIDGTLTRSDVRGYVETVYLGKYDYVHDGAVTFFSTLQKEFSVCHLYLTSRPLHHLEDTKAFLRLVEDRHGHHLPLGPLFTNKENVMRAIYRELVAKTSAQFKGSVLVDVMSLFIQAGAEHTPYCLGVGNKETDALAYRMAGLNPSRILLVQPNSTIVISVLQKVDPSDRDSMPWRPESAKFRPESTRLSAMLNWKTPANQPENEPLRTDLSFNTYSDPGLWQYVRLKMLRNFPTFSPISSKTLKAQDSARIFDLETLQEVSVESLPVPELVSMNPSTALLPQPLRLCRAKSEGSYYLHDNESAPPRIAPPPVDFHCAEPTQINTPAPTFKEEGKSKSLNIISQKKSTSSQTPKAQTPNSTRAKKKLKDMTDFFNPVESADI